jgi:hypothetical protein
MSLYLFDGSIPSMGALGGNSPGFLCPARVFGWHKGSRYILTKINIALTQSQKEPFLTGVDIPIGEYEAVHGT